MKRIFTLLFIITFILSPVTGFAQNNSDPFIIADSLYKVKDFKGAIERYTNFINVNGNNKAQLIQALHKRAASNFELKLFEAVIKDENEALKVDSLFKNAYWTRAAAYYNLGDLKNATRDYSKAIDLYKNNPQSLSTLLLTRGWLYEKAADHKTAIKDFSKVIELNIDLAPAYSNRGLSYNSLNEYQLAIDDFTSALFYCKDNVQLALIYLFRGQTKTYLKKNKDGINDFNLAIDLNPSLKFAYFNRGFALHTNGDYELSSKDYDKAIPLYQGDKKMLVQLYDMRASNERYLKHFDKALADISLGLALNPEYGSLYWTRAMVYSEQGECKLAIEDYYKAMNFYKNTDYLAAMHRAVASELYILKENKRVIEECALAIKLNPNESGPYFTRAKVYLKRLGDKEQAIKDFHKAIELDTSKSSTSYIFSQFYTGNTELAMQLLQKEVLKTPDPNDVLVHYYNIACMFSIMNEPDKANVYLKKAIDSGHSKKFAANDEDFDNIRNTPGYISIIGAAK